MDTFICTWTVGREDADTVSPDGSLALVEWSMPDASPVLRRPTERAVGCHAGSDTSIALTDRGGVVQWGARPALDGAQPRKLALLEPVAALACGLHHVLAITESGRALSWGRGEHGRLGHGDERDVAHPKEIVSLRAFAPIAAVAAGGAHSVSLSARRDVLCWGRNHRHQCAQRRADRVSVPLRVPPSAWAGTTPERVYCGGDHTGVLSGSGELWTWGASECGQLGHSDHLTHCAFPGRARVEHDGLQLGVSAAAMGEQHTLMLAADQTVYACGANERGQCGVSGSANVRIPRRVPALQDMRAVQVCAGRRHSAAIMDDGQLFEWGGRPRQASAAVGDAAAAGAAGHAGNAASAGSTTAAPALTGSDEEEDEHADAAAVNSAGATPHVVPGLEAHWTLDAACGGAHTVVVVRARLPHEQREGQGLAEEASEPASAALLVQLALFGAHR